ncbi:hypothetical protein L873DRAFT_1819193 [Choiromyces venosus 120613-1]|uniref:Uncharacterized protein n=1 Tax=Choiromyces venosus 120613-1 TaxID=1336337 RepID=A0A3N4J372_9PEZI|nr:hypothetical protein L873DRAFT_1819193 [Choiromyces venosus 120613-1]
MDQETLDHVRELQYRVSRAEELIVKFGAIGIKEAVAWVLSLESQMEGGYCLRRGWGMGSGRGGVWK